MASLGAPVTGDLDRPVGRDPGPVWAPRTGICGRGTEPTFETARYPFGVPSTTRTRALKIVAGVDGSESSIAALRWAARQAELTGATLHVVTAWSYPEHPTPFGIVPDLPLSADALSDARQKLVEVVGAELGGHVGITVHTEVVHGNAAPVLLDAARDADLLVVGSRGQGAFAGMLLGSVSEHCVRHATCPVVVVRDGP